MLQLSVDDILCLKHTDSSAESSGNRRQANSVDFVLAYDRRRKVATKTNTDNKRDDETERRLFYRELRANGILVNVDDDPTVSTLP